MPCPFSTTSLSSRHRPPHHSAPTLIMSCMSCKSRPFCRTTRSVFQALQIFSALTTAQDSPATQWMKNTTCVDSVSGSLRSLTPRLPDHSRSSFWYVHTSSTSAMQIDSSLQRFSRINLPPPTRTHALRVLAWICLSPERTSFVCLPWRDA
jgi:hypothetical protein